jgi:regulator of sigma E protease
VARRNGVEAEEFGIFFPPTLLRKKMKSGFDFTINLLPLGGFVKLKGEYDADRRPGSFGAASFWVKTKIILAGVFINLITALILFTALALVGMPQIVDGQFTVKSDTHQVVAPESHVVIGTPEKDSPAAKAGLRDGDTIRSIRLHSATTATKLQTSDELRTFTTTHQGKAVIIVYERDGKVHEVPVTLRSQADIDVAAKAGKTIGRLGVPLATVQDTLGVVRSTWSAPVVSVGVTAQLTKLTFQGLGTALRGLGGIIAGTVTGDTAARQNAQSEASSQVGGPIAIFMTLKEGSRFGLGFIVMIIAYISLMLAIMNVLPIPGLDGGRLFVIALARLFKKPLTKKVEEAVYGVGFVVLIGLIILITIVDVRRFF